VAAADVGDVGPALQRGVDLRHQRDPLLDQQVVEPSPREPLYALPDVGVDVLPGDASAAAEGLHHPVQRPDQADRLLLHAAQEERSALLGQHRRVRGR